MLYLTLFLISKYMSNINKHIAYETVKYWATLNQYWDSTLKWGILNPWKLSSILNYYAMYHANQSTLMYNLH